MKPYTPPTNRGRKRAVDDIHHRSADQPRRAARRSAKAARHGARREGRRDAAMPQPGAARTGAAGRE